MDTPDTPPLQDDDLHTVVCFFKALADESRLRLLGLLALQERSVDELAALLGLTAPTVSHHLNLLKALGLARMRPEGTTHVYRLDAQPLRDLSQAVLSRDKLASLAEGTQGEAWERKVLRDFFEGERLKGIPAARKKRYVVLEWLARRFDPERRYSEREVNEIIKRHHPDAETLRRELIGNQLMQRENGVYWRVPDTEVEAARRDRKWAY